MSQELLYTSAPRGLKPGSRGFCTVLTTRGMTTWLVERLESLSGYRHVFLPNDPQADKNPVLWSHLRVPAGGKQYDVLSRVGAYGLDYSSRTNKLAHHVVVESGEQTEAGPAWLLSNPGALQSDWDGEVQALPHGRSLPQGSLACTVCQTWARLTGDAGWAGVVAESFLADPHRLVYLVFEPGQDLLPLLVEVQSLLPPAVRWQVTFSTYYTGLPQDIPCVWRCVLKGSEEARMARRFPQSLQIDLTTPLQTAAGGALVEAARTGILPVAAAVATVDQSIDPEEPQVESPELPVAAKKQAAKPGEYGLQGEFAVEGGPPPIQPALRRQEKTKQRRREKRLWGGLASAAILLVAVTTYFWWNSRGGGTAGNPRLVAQQEVSGKASRPKRQKPRPETPVADVSDQTEGQDASPKDGPPSPIDLAKISAGNGGTPPKDGAGDGRETEMLVGVALKTPENVEKSKTKPPDAVPGKSTPPQNVPPKQNPETKPDEETSKPTGPNPKKAQSPPTTPPKKPEIPVHYAGFMHHKDFNKLGEGVEDITDLRVICSGNSLSCKPSESKDYWTLQLGEQEIAKCGMLETPESKDGKDKASKEGNDDNPVFAFEWINDGKKHAHSIVGRSLIEIKTGKATHVYVLWQPLFESETSINDLFGSKTKTRKGSKQKSQSQTPDMETVIATTLSQDLKLKFKKLIVRFDNVDFDDWRSQPDLRKLISDKLKQHLSTENPEGFDKSFKRAATRYYDYKAMISGGSLKSLVSKEDVLGIHSKAFQSAPKIDAVSPTIIIRDNSHHIENHLGKLDLHPSEKIDDDFLKDREGGLTREIVSAVSAQLNPLSEDGGKRKFEKNRAAFIEQAHKFIITADQHRFQNTAMLTQLTISTTIDKYEVDLIRIK